MMIMQSMLSHAAMIATQTDVGGAPSSISIGMLVPAAALGVGLVLLIFGRLIMRPAFLLAGLALGAAAGLVLVSIIQPSVPAWTVALAGAIVVGVVSILAYRPTLGIGLALLLGIAGPVGVISWAESRGINLLNPQQQQTSTEHDDTLLAESGGSTYAREDLSRLVTGFRETWQLLRDADHAIEDVRRFGESRIGAADSSTILPREDQPEEDAPEADEAGGLDAAEVAAWIERFQQTLADAREEFQRRWDAAPPSIQRSIMLSSVCGAIFGLLIGLFAPAFAASLLTAMAGAGLAMLGAGGVHDTLGLGLEGWLPRSGMQWLTVWLIIATLGVVLQWTVLRRRAPKEE